MVIVIYSSIQTEPMVLLDFGHAGSAESVEADLQQTIIKDGFLEVLLQLLQLVGVM